MAFADLNTETLGNQAQLAVVDTTPTTPTTPLHTTHTAHWSQVVPSPLLLGSKRALFHLNLRRGVYLDFLTHEAYLARFFQSV